MNHKYLTLQHIGSGSQANVYSAVDKSNHNLVALKLFEHNAVSWNEIMILKRIQKLSLKYSVTMMNTFSHNNQLCLVMEYVQGVELIHLISDRKFLDCDRKLLFKNLLLAVNELHTNDICHLDLKLENILVDRKTCEVKLVDFGFAQFTKESGCDRLITQFFGSIHYSAPEIIRNLPFDGKKADIWALGCLLFILLTQRFPFPGNQTRFDYNSIANQILSYRISYPSYFDPLTINLLSKMMAIDPNKRPPIDLLLQHPWFSKLIL